MIQLGLVAARFAHYTALTLLFGAAVFLLFAAGTSRSEGAGVQVVEQLRLALRWFSLAALASAMLVLAFTAASMKGALGGMADLPTLRTILVDTDFGRVWSFRMAVAMFLTLWLWRRCYGVRSDRIVLLLSGALLITVALTGHAQIRTGLDGLAHRAADAGHLVAAAVWLGALPPFLLLLKAARTEAGEGVVQLGRLLQRFHLVGLLAVAALLGTGLVNSRFLVGDPSGLLTTPYGRILLAKLLLFAVMIGLAADNRLRLVPRLRRALEGGLPPELWLARLRGRIRGEFLLGLIVLLLVSVLGAVAPAIDAAGPE